MGGVDLTGIYRQCSFNINGKDNCFGSLRFSGPYRFDFTGVAQDSHICTSFYVYPFYFLGFPCMIHLPVRLSSCFGTLLFFLYKYDCALDLFQV